MLLSAVEGLGGAGLGSRFQDVQTQVSLEWKSMILRCLMESKRSLGWMLDEALVAVLLEWRTLAETPCVYRLDAGYKTKHKK